MHGWTYLAVRVVEDATSEQMCIMAILQRSAAEPDYHTHTHDSCKYLPFDEITLII